MGKRVVLQLLRGYAVTVGLCLLIQMAVGLACGSVVAPAFGARFRSEGVAALAQLGLTGMIGAAFSGAALLFDVERWSYLRQGIAHFLVTAAVWVPVVWLCWMPVSWTGRIWSLAGWTLTYAVNWTIQYFLYRRRIAELNRRIRSRQGKERADEGD